MWDISWVGRGWMARGVENSSAGLLELPGRNKLARNERQIASELSARLPDVIEVRTEREREGERDRGEAATARASDSGCCFSLLTSIRSFSSTLYSPGPLLSSLLAVDLLADRSQGWERRPNLVSLHSVSLLFLPSICRFFSSPTTTTTTGHSSRHPTAILTSQWPPPTPVGTIAPWPSSLLLLLLLLHPPSSHSSFPISATISSSSSFHLLLPPPLVLILPSPFPRFLYFCRLLYPPLAESRLSLWRELREPESCLRAPDHGPSWWTPVEPPGTILVGARSLLDSSVCVCVSVSAAACTHILRVALCTSKLCLLQGTIPNDEYDVRDAPSNFHSLQFLDCLVRLFLVRLFHLRLFVTLFLGRQRTVAIP